MIDMVKQKKKQPYHKTSISRFFWLVPLIIVGLFVGLLGIVGWLPPMILVLFACLFIGLMRSSYLVIVSSIALLYAAVAAICSIGLALGIALWNIYGDESAIMLLGPVVLLNIPLITAFVAYFHYKYSLFVQGKNKINTLPGQQTFIRVFWVTIGAIVVLNLWMIIGIQVSSSTIVGLGFPFTLGATFFALLSVRRRSWVAMLVALVFFGISIGFAVQNVIWDSEARLSVDVISAQYTLVIALLSCFIGSTLASRSRQE